MVLRCGMPGLIRIDTFGAGPPIVLLHGWAMHGGILAPLARELAPFRTVHVVDLPGHGDSGWHDGEAFTLEACVAAVAPGVPTAPWLGWSLGGLVALRAAVDRVDTISGVVALAATSRFTRTDDWPYAVDDRVLAGFAAGLATDHDGTLRRFLALEAQGSSQLREEVRFLQQQMDERPVPHPRVLTDGLSILRTTDLREDMPGLTVPSLWIGGRRDRLAPWPAVAASAALAPGSAQLCVPHAGHAPFLSHPGDVARGIAEWLGRHSL